MSGAGQPPRVRTSYDSDAQMLLHLCRAIDADTKRPEEWRERVRDQLKGVITELMQAPDGK